MYQKWQLYNVWFLRYWAQQTEFFVILDHFLSFYPPNLKNQNSEKIKKTHGYIIVLHKCTINDNHMMYIWFLGYEIWQTEFFVILDCFLPFYPSNNMKNQHFEKLKKKSWRYHHFTRVNQKSWSCAILFLRYGV